jgi:hypothetical protein
MTLARHALQFVGIVPDKPVLGRPDPEKANFREHRFSGPTLIYNPYCSCNVPTTSGHEYQKSIRFDHGWVHLCKPNVLVVSECCGFRLGRSVSLIVGRFSDARSTCQRRTGWKRPYLPSGPGSDGKLHLLFRCDLYLCRGLAEAQFENQVPVIRPS